jgi:5-methylcytosine-specific restriction endonuclease McrA
MAERTCLWCGAPINFMRSNAQYCCLQHKKNAASKRHRERNPGYYARYTQCERQLAWRERNIERLRADAREYQNKLPDRAERGKRWREDNRVYFQVRERNRRAAKANNPDSVGVSQRDWIRLCRRHSGCCAYCEQQPEGTLEMDHIIPLTKGGRHAIGNIAPACRDCNMRKGNKYLVVWLRQKAYHLAGELYGGVHDGGEVA